MLPVCHWKGNYCEPVCMRRERKEHWAMLGSRPSGPMYSSQSWPGRSAPSWAGHWEPKCV
eukprot:scaffold339490_cov43-Prasinocladus_malaysianus.AAC.1